MFDLAEKIGLNRRAGYPWTQGAHVDPLDDSSEVKPYVPESSYGPALEFLREYARGVQGAAEVVLAIEKEAPPGPSQPISSQEHSVAGGAP